ncbi:MAG: hypothetical protein KG003_03495 [Bacteroidetes bacterium]|nr:hypothetical protein [Bacteroidota bacterium]
MNSPKTSNTRKIFLALLSMIIIGVSAGLYIYNMPPRDVVNSGADLSIHAGKLVNEFLMDGEAANGRYLAEDGDSKILQISGNVYEISEDLEGMKVVVLRDQSDKAGVSCTFTKATNSELAGLKPGMKVTIKGVIRSGASYDSDLEMYENVILEKCNLIK